MDAFWTFARKMLRYRMQVVLAIVCAIISAGGLGAGIVAAQPVLKLMLAPDQAGTLPEIAATLNQNPIVNGRIPQAWIDALPADKWNTMVWFVVGLGFLTMVGATANFVHQFLALTVVHRTIARVRREAFGRLLHLPLKTIVADGTSDAVSRVINDSEALSEGLRSLLNRAVAQTGKGAALLVAAFVIDWRVAGATLVVAPLLYTVIRKLGKRIRRAAKRALAGRAELYGAATEAMQGLRVVKVHTTERYEAGRFGRINKEVLRQNLKVRTARALSTPLIEGISVFVLGAIMLFGVKLSLDGHLDPVKFIATLAALGGAGASLKPLTGLVNNIQASGAAADRLLQLMDAEPEGGHGAGLPKLDRHAESIEFEDVWLTYPNATKPALQGVSLKVMHGETVAFVGPNGSGKTTVLSLVPRLFDPDAGHVFIDGTELTTVGVRSLRRQIGVVTQETVLFAGTIRDNIAYGAEGATEERIIDAAKRARAHEFIEALPGGYGAVVGEQGLTMSGGQRQRIAIARAILRDPAILILDEATSMIDAESESQIGAAIGDFSKGRTSLIVAHRLITVMNADRIVVLDQGKVVGVGGHDELLETCEVYQQIAKRQLIPAE